MMRSSSNASGSAANGMTWTIWTNSGPGTITYFTNANAFAGSWNGSGDYLARLGLQWNNTKTYDQYGTITAQFASRKTGSGGGYSYIGIYGWSTNPCVEFYIVDDSYNRMPVNPGSTVNKGTVTIDGAPYIMYTRQTNGTGGSKCGSSINSWAQYYSVRMTARTCGQISVTEHFKAWAGLGMPLGKMDQAQIFVETGGGTGNIEFPVAQMSATMP
jgi:endo-1,4-beta-xylanase